MFLPSCQANPAFPTFQTEEVIVEGWHAKMSTSEHTDPLEASSTASASSSRSGSPIPLPSSAVKVRRTSHDSLAAHPLSSDDNDAQDSVDAIGLAVGQESPSTKPSLVKGNSSYAVYKPRQRPVSVGSAPSLAKSPPPYNPTAQLAVATTSTSLTPANTEPVTASPKSPRSVTAKLQLQSLQATAQAAGLASDSAGWQIVQKLIADHDQQKDPGWTMIYTALRTGKAALLLPKESAAASEITPKLLRDHLLLKDGTNVVTLSGIRGYKAKSVCAPVPNSELTMSESATRSLSQHAYRASILKRMIQVKHRSSVS